ncbi:hypothetical protein B0H19DRAFT_1304179 [Mycena capillaripes]|nr:hypothetical protein B0H19DRAFT_1304179 [Mycena capillaripes]
MKNFLVLIALTLSVVDSRLLSHGDSTEPAMLFTYNVHAPRQLDGFSFPFPIPTDSDAPSSTTTDAPQLQTDTPNQSQTTFSGCIPSGFPSSLPSGFPSSLPSGASGLPSGISLPGGFSLPAGFPTGLSGLDPRDNEASGCQASQTQGGGNPQVTGDAGQGTGLKGSPPPPTSTGKNSNGASGIHKAAGPMVAFVTLILIQPIVFNH